MHLHRKQMVLAPMLIALPRWVFSCCLIAVFVRFHVACRLGYEAKRTGRTRMCVERCEQSTCLWLI